MSADAHFLSLKVRLEHSFGGFVGMTVGMPGDGSFSAYRTFICHDKPIVQNYIQILEGG